MNRCFVLWSILMNTLKKLNRSSVLFDFGGIVRGKFIGKSSMGFRNGVTYNIRSDIQKIRKGAYPFCEDMMCNCIYDMNSKAWCP